MKYLILIVVLFVVACTTTTKVPCACQRNLQDCVTAYEDDKVEFCKERGNQQCSKDDWMNLCHLDLASCKVGWGVR